MLESHSAFLSCKTEYYVFLPQIRASLAQNRLQVKQIRQFHQIQIQATEIKQETDWGLVGPSLADSYGAEVRPSYIFRLDGMDSRRLYGGFPVRF